MGLILSFANMKFQNVIFFFALFMALSCATSIRSKRENGLSTIITTVGDTLSQILGGVEEPQLVPSKIEERSCVGYNSVSKKHTLDKRSPANRIILSQRTLKMERNEAGRPI